MAGSPIREDFSERSDADQAPMETLESCSPGDEKTPKEFEETQQEAAAMKAASAEKSTHGK